MKPVLGLTSLAVGVCLELGAAIELSLDYEAPAATWNEALPIGNGRLGAMVFGGPDAERLQLNEDKLWDGKPSYMLQPKLKALVPEIQKLVFAGKEQAAVDLFRKETGGWVSQRNTSDAYQTLGSLVFVLRAMTCRAPTAGRCRSRTSSRPASMRRRASAIGARRSRRLPTMCWSCG